jgi:hypothetical protein
MDAVLPFEGFLDVLRAKGYGVSLHEYFALANLLNHWDRTNAEEFGDAMAALVGRNEEEVAGIRRLFAEIYLRPPQPVPTELKPPPPVPVQRYLWIAAAAVAIVLIIVAGSIQMRRVPPLPQQPPQQQTPPPQTSTATPLTPLELPPPAAPTLPAPPRVIDRGIAIAVVTIVFLMALTVFWALKTRDTTDRWVREAWASALAALPGPFHFGLVVHGRVGRLPREDVEDAATILGRTFTPEALARQLDVRRSVRLTLRRGLMPQLVFKPRRIAQTIVVFQDVCQEMQLWQPKIDAFLADLLRQGIALERWYFDGDPRTVSDAPRRAPIRFDTVARRRPDSPLLMISSGSGIESVLATGDDAWLACLRGAVKRSWMTPVADVRLWPDVFRALPLDVWPMTRDGLARVAKELAGIEGEPAERLKARIAAAGFVAQDDIERMKRLASVVPHPTTELLEILRQRFAPDVPDAVVVHLLAQSITRATNVLRLSDEEIGRALDAMRRETPRLEAAARRAVLTVLRDSEPQLGSAAHERWRLSVALQSLQLAQLEGANPSAALEALRDLGQGPMWEEVRNATRRMASNAALAGRIEKALGTAGRMARRPPDATRVAESRQPWSWPAARELVPAAAVALIVFAAGRLLNAFPARAVEHVQNAYRLDYVPQPAAPGLRIQLVPGAAAAPSAVAVTQDSTVFRTNVAVNAATPTSIALTSGDTGHYYQVRATLAQGNLAISNAVWVPSDRELVVSIDALPWANVTLRSDRATIGPQATPFSASLLPGRYQLHFDNGGVTPPMDQVIDVSPTSRAFRFTMPGFDAARTAGQLAR